MTLARHSDQCTSEREELTMCEYRPVSGFEGMYEVSRDGIVRSIDRYVNTKGGAKQFRPGRILKQSMSNAGYLRVHIRNGAKGKNASVHRLVALAFVPNPDGKAEVNHKDGDKLNNSAENLEWVTPSENMRHALVLGLVKERDMSQLCEANKKRVIVDGLHEFESVKAAAEFIGCSSTQVSSVLMGRYKTTHGHTVEYVQ